MLFSKSSPGQKNVIGKPIPSVGRSFACSNFMCLNCMMTWPISSMRSTLISATSSKRFPSNYSWPIPIATPICLMRNSTMLVCVAWPLASPPATPTICFVVQCFRLPMPWLFRLLRATLGPMSTIFRSLQPVCLSKSMRSSSPITAKAI